MLLLYLQTCLRVTQRPGPCTHWVLVHVISWIQGRTHGWWRKCYLQFTWRHYQSAGEMRLVKYTDPMLEICSNHCGVYGIAVSTTFMNVGLPTYCSALNMYINLITSHARNEKLSYAMHAIHHDDHGMYTVRCKLNQSLYRRCKEPCAHLMTCASCAHGSNNWWFEL